MLAVAGAGHRNRVSTALVQGAPQPVGQVDLSIARDGARRPRPVAGASPGGGDGKDGTAGVGQQGSRDPCDV